LPLIGDDAVDLGEDRVIPPHPHVFSGVNAGSELPDQDISGPHGLSAVNFYAASLSIAVAAVSRAAACFLVCHLSFLLLKNLKGCAARLRKAGAGRIRFFVSWSRLRLDRVDPNRRKRLPMPLFPAVTLSAFELEDDDFPGPILCDNLSGNRGVFEDRSADPQIVAVGKHQDLIEGYRSADFARNFLDPQNLPFFDLILFSARGDNSVHLFPPLNRDEISVR
jgi:hypothetical protein